MRSTLRLACSSSLAALASLLLVAGSARADEPAPAPSGTATTPPAASAPADAPAAAPPTPAAPATAAAPAPAPAPAAAPAPLPAAPPQRAAAPAELSSSSSTPSDGPADAPATEGDTRRAEGVRLGLELGFARAFDGAADRLNAGSPTLLPIGADVSFRTSPGLLLGFHGYAALASRDDCISVDSCRARAYGFGGHIESPLSRSTTSLVPYIRYGVGYEILYQGGAPLDSGGHIYRGAFDFLDLRLGADFIATRGSAGKTGRIGAYAGLVGGVLTSQTGVSHLNGSGGSPRDLDKSSGSAHLWFAMGLRGTLDP